MDIDAFLSYARVDSPFVIALTGELEARARTPWLDSDDIPAGTTWREELQTAIETCIAFVFIITPESVASVECQKELARAVELGKRLIPVRLRDAPTPEALASIQWIDADLGPVATAAALDAAIDTDYAWAREHTHWLERALEWDRRSSASLLPRGEDLRNAETWLARQSEGHEPRPTELQTRYIGTARQRERGALRRVALLTTTALIVVGVLAIVAYFQKRTADEQRDQAQSRALAASAEATLDTDPVAGLALAAAGQAKVQTAQSVTALRDALTATHLRRVLRAGGSALNRTAISADGKLIATGDIDGGVRLFASGSSRSLPGLKGLVKLLAFRGPQLVALDEGGTVRVWDTSDGRLVKSFEVGRKVWTAESDARADRLVVVTPEGTKVWSVPDGRLVRSLDLTPAERTQERAALDELPTLGGPVDTSTTLAISSDGRRVLSSEAGGPLRLWDLASGEQSVLGRFPPLIATLAFSPDGTLVVASGGDKKVHVFDAVGREKYAFSGDAPAFSPDSRLIVVGVPSQQLGSVTGEAEIRDAHTGRRIVRLDYRAPSIQGMSFSPDSKFAAIESYDGSSNVFDLATGDKTAALDARGTGVDVDFAPDGRHIVTAGNDGVARVWDTGVALVRPDPKSPLIGARFDASGRHVFAASMDSWAALADSRTGADPDAGGCVPRTGRNCLSVGIASIAGTQPISADMERSGKRIAIGTMGGFVALLDTRTGALSAPLATLGSPVMEVRFSPDGRTLVAETESGTAQIVDAVTGRAGPKLPHTKNFLAGAAFLDDGATVVTISIDPSVRLWRARDGRKLAERHIAGSIFALDIATGPGDLVAIADGEAVRLLNPRSDALPRTLAGQPGQVSAVAVSRDGAFVAGGGADTSVRVWEQRTGRLVATFDGRGGATESLDFSPDGRRLLAAGQDGIARIYDCEACASPAQLATLAEQRLDALLTPRERAALLR